MLEIALRPLTLRRRRWRCGLFERADAILPRPAHPNRGPCRLEWLPGAALSSRHFRHPTHPERTTTVRAAGRENGGLGPKPERRSSSQRRGELQSGSARRHAAMGPILKSAAAIKIGKRHRRQGQGEDGSAAMRGHTAGVCAVRGLPVVDRQRRAVLCSVTIRAP